MNSFSCSTTVGACISPSEQLSSIARFCTRITLALLIVIAVPFSSVLADQNETNIPIIFVHGQSGSAQQFETQAMRFTSNGYPQELLFAFEYDTSSLVNPLNDLDQFIDAVKAQTGAEQVNAIGHSRGTSVWTAYLDDPAYEGAKKVARYVNIDGRSPPELPGGVPTIGIWGEWNTAGSGYNRRGDTNAQIGPDPASNYYFGTKSHTEVATSAEAFALMYEFLTGESPVTTDVIPEPPGQVRVKGRAVIFPENIGFDGSTLEVWRVDHSTGHRISNRPLAVYDIDSSGEFGPVNLNGRKHYEFALHRPATAIIPFETVHHFYAEPFSRSDYFLRLQSSQAGQGLEAYTANSLGTTNLVITRQREFWGDQGEEGDRLLVDGLDVVLPNTSPRTGVNLAVFTYDEGLDGITDTSKGELFPFNLLTFLTAVDVATTATPDGSGSVSVIDISRGSGNATEINVPNWPSSTDRISVQFRDDDQQDQVFPPGGRN